MRKMSSTFSAIGVLTYKTKPELKIYDSKKSLWKGYGLQLCLRVDGGMHFVDLFGGDMFKDGAKTVLGNFTYINQDKQKIELTREQTMDSELLSAIPNYKKYKFNNKEYVYQTEFIQEVYNNLDSLKDKLVYVNGDIELSYSKKGDRVYKRFLVRNITLAQNQDDVQRFNGNVQIYFDSNSVDPSIFANKAINQRYIQEMGNKIIVNGYLSQYNSDKDTKDTVPFLYYPLEFTIKTDKIDFGNPEHVKVLMFMIMQCTPSNSREIVTSGWKITFKKGNTEVELTDEQKKNLLSKEELSYIQLFPEEEKAFLSKKLNVLSEKMDEIRLASPHSTMPIKEVVEDISSDSLQLYKTIGVYGGKEESSESKPTTEPSASVDFSMFA